MEPRKTHEEGEAVECEAAQTPKALHQKLQLSKKENLQTSSNIISYSKQQNIHVFSRDVARNFPAREQKLTTSQEED